MEPKILAIFVIIIFLGATILGIAMLPEAKLLSRMQDVSFIALSDGQVLTYNSTTGNWTNQNVNATGSTTLAGLSDVKLVGLVDGQILFWNSTANEWENADTGFPANFSDLNDVLFGVLSDWETVVYNSTSGKWINVGINATIQQVMDVYALGWKSAWNTDVDSRIAAASILWEQISQGNSTVQQIIDAYNIAWKSIWDVNVTTLISESTIVWSQIIDANLTVQEIVDAYSLAWKDGWNVTVNDLISNYNIPWSQISAANETVNELISQSAIGWSQITNANITVEEIIDNYDLAWKSAWNSIVDERISEASITWEQITNANSTVQQIIDDYIGTNINLDDLADVIVLGVQNNQLIQYNSTSEKWENRDPETYARYMSELLDVSLVGLANGQILRYNSTSEKWENQEETVWYISTLSDVTVNGLNNLQILQYNSTSGKWENKYLPAWALNNLTDVSFTSLVNGNIIQYNSTSGKWYNVAPTTWALSMLSDVNITSLAHGQMLQYDAVSARWVNVNAPNGTYVSANPPWYDSALVGYWQLNEGTGTTANDDSGNNNVGTIYEAGYTVGKFNSGLSFDGVDDYVDVPSSSSLNLTSAFTISLWVKYNTVPQPVANFLLWKGSVRCQYAIGTLTASESGFRVYVSNTTTTRYNTELVSVSVGVWLHVVTMFNGSYLSVYKNAVDTGVGLAIDSPLTSDTTSMRFGNRPFAGYTPFNGTIDDIRIYDRALTQTDISTLYYGGLQSYAGQLWYNTATNLLYARNSANSAWNFVSSGFAFASSFPPYGDSGLAAYWMFNDGSGLIASDDSGNANTGTITGATWTGGKYGKALDFDTDYVVVADSASLTFGTGDFSVSAWVKTSGYATGEHIIIRKDNTGTPRTLWGLATGTTNVIFQIYSSVVGTTKVTPGKNIADGLYHHVVGVRSGDNIILYVDGVLISSTSGCSAFDFNTAGQVNLGKYIEVDSGYWVGGIDEVRIYNRAITTVEISTLYYGGLQSYAGQLWLNTTSDVLYIRNNNNSAWNFIASDIQGFSATTPSFPASATDVTNTNPFPVRIYILTIGTTTAMNITDPSGTMTNIATTLYAGQEITLDPKAKIRFTYSYAPTWKWYGAG